MFSKSYRIYYFYNICLTVIIILSDKFQNIQFNKSLFRKVRFISNKLNSTNLFSFMIKYFNTLTKGASTNHFNYFISICNMIFYYNMILSLFIIESNILFQLNNLCFYFNFMSFMPNEINIDKTINLLHLKRSQKLRILFKCSVRS
jgi:hypothetical protein